MHKHLIPNVRIQGYIEKLNDEGFEVLTSEDQSKPGNYLLMVRKNGVKFAGSLAVIDFLDPVKLDFVLRAIVRKVETELLKEKTND